MRLPASVRRVGRQALSKAPLLDGLLRRFVWSRIHFPDAEMRYLNSIEPGSVDVAVDVGAAMGSYTWILSRVAKHVYAFEPGVVHSEYLGRLTSYSNIDVIRAAVGSTHRRVTLFTPGADADALHAATVSQANPVVKQKDACSRDVEQVSLDGFLAERLQPGRAVDILKVDVEGYELEVLKGSIGLLSMHRPLTICEIEARHNPSYTEVFGLLSGLGYRCYILRSGSFRVFSGERIEDLQQERDLATRMSRNYDLDADPYINNFVFEHPRSRIRITE